MTGSYDWRGDIGDVWAEEWRRTDRSLAPVNEALVAQAIAHAGAGARIVDIGCGAGATSLALADALPGAKITGLDLSEALVAVARERAAGKARFEVGDASAWVPAEGVFDLIVSRHGVMFFDDPVRAFTHIGTLARPGGRLIFSCFRARMDNEWVRAMRPLFERFAPETLGAPDPPAGPFAFADPARIESILSEAGFAPPKIAPLDFDFTVGAGDDPVADAIGYFRRVGPVAAMLATLDQPTREAAMDQLAAIASTHETGGHVTFGAAAWIVTSERP